MLVWEKHLECGESNLKVTKVIRKRAKHFGSEQSKLKVSKALRKYAKQVKSEQSNLEMKKLQHEASICLSYSIVVT